MFAQRLGSRWFGLGVLTVGLLACQPQQQQQAERQSPARPTSFSSGGFEGIESRQFSLLKADCSDPTGATVTIQVASGEFAYLYSRPGDGKVVVNANYGSSQCLIDSSKKIAITASDSGGSHKVLLDYLNGPFAVGDASNIGIAIDLGASGSNQVMIRASEDHDYFSLGSNADGSISYIGYTTAKDPAVPSAPTFASVSLTHVSDITISTGPGNDVITGQNGMTKPDTLTKILTGDISLTIFGGVGDDKITSGAAGSGQNSLNGNAGSDLFYQASALAHDVISGGSDSQTTLVDTGTTTNTNTYTNTLTETGNGTDTQTVTSTVVPYTATVTLTATLTGTKTAATSQTTTGTLTRTATGEGTTTATWTQTYNGVGTDAGKTLTANNTLTATNTLTHSFTVTATGSKTATGTRTATVSGTATATHAETQVYTITTTSYTSTAVQTDTSIDVVDYGDRTAKVKVTLGDESVAESAYAKVIVPNSAAIRNYDSFSINDGTIYTATALGTATHTDTDSNTVTDTVTNTYTGHEATVEFHRTGTYVVGTIVAPNGGADLANDDTLTVYDGSLKSDLVTKKPAVTFHILVDTGTDVGTTTHTNTNLQIHVGSTSTPEDVAHAIAAGIQSYQAITWTSTATGTSTMTSTSISPQVTVKAMDETDSAVTIQNRVDNSSVTLLASNNTKITLSTSTVANVWTANPGAILVDIADAEPPSTSVEASTVIATRIAGKIPGSSGVEVGATSSGAFVTITSSESVKSVRTAFAVTAPRSSAFDVVAGSQGTPPEGPGANDGDVDGSENDSIMFDVEMVIGSSKDDIIDATHAATVPHIFYGMSGNDTLTCSASSSLTNYLYGGKGDDHLLGGGGVDYVYGGDGDDYVAGGPGDDHISGDGVNCVVSASATGIFQSTVCDATYAASAGATTSNFLDYSDRIVSVTVDLSTLGTATQIGATGEKDAVVQCTNVRGGAGNDSLTGDSGSNIIYGGPGDDTINGGAGSDSLYGDSGNDIVSGEDGNDFIYGGTGYNTLSGDGGSATGAAGNNMLDNSDGRKGVVACGAGDMDILFSNGEESGANTCELK